MRQNFSLKKESLEDLKLKRPNATDSGMAFSRHRLRPWKEEIPVQPHLKGGSNLIDRSPREAKPERLRYSTSPIPPEAEIRIAPQALQKLIQQKVVHNTHEARLFFQKCYQEISQLSAGAEYRFNAKSDTASLAIEFFNCMANQEFYPHLPSLLGSPYAPAFGGQQVWLDLPSELETRTQIYQEAQAFWRQGIAVSFLLDSPHRKYNHTLESFENFVASVEQAILGLPESVEIPESVGLYLSAENPWAIDFVRLARSGKYYPRFTFSLILPKNLQKGLALSEKTQANQVLELLIQELANNDETLYLLGEELPIQNSKSSWPSYPIPRLGGGPALAPYEICQLGSLNVAILANGSEVDWAKLRRMIKTAVHFLDNLFEVTDFASEKSALQSLGNRKIGLGVMGFADLVERLGLRFESSESQRLGERLMRFIQEETLRNSMELAQERGCFPNYESSSWNDSGKRLRHASCNAIVPSTFLADIAGVAPGIEPRHDSSESASLSWNQKLQSCFQKYCDGAVEIFMTEEDFQSLSQIKKTLKRAIEWNIRQVHFKNHLESSNGWPTALEISEPATGEVTEIEMPHSTFEPRESNRLEDKAQANATEFSNSKTLDEDSGNPKHQRIRIQPRKRPEVLKAMVRNIPTAYGPMSVTIGYDEFGPYELQAHLGKNGSEVSAQVEAMSRLVTLLLSSGVEPRLIYEQLKDIRSPQVVSDQGEEILSCADAIAKILDREFQFLKKPIVAAAQDINKNEFLEDREENGGISEKEIWH